MICVRLRECVYEERKRYGEQLNKQVTDNVHKSFKCPKQYAKSERCFMVFTEIDNNVTLCSENT